MLSCKHATHRAALCQNLLIIRLIAGPPRPGSDGSAARQRNDAMCHKRSLAPSAAYPPFTW